MLIRALCDYYDELSKNDKIPRKGYKKIQASYIVCLNEDGTINDILELKNDAGKLGKNVIIPEVYKQTTTVKPYIIETRSAYLFGINKKGKQYEVNEDKFIKFKEEYLKFLKDLSSPIVDAFKNYINNWNPKDGIDNSKLLNLDLNKHFIFCLSNDINKFLHDDEKIKNKCNEILSNELSDFQDDNTKYQVSAISGEVKKISEVHNKIKISGNPMGSALVSYKFSAYQSYGKEKALNSNISEDEMEKYTVSLNYLLENNDRIISNLHNVYFAVNCNKEYEDLYQGLMYGINDDNTIDVIEDKLGSLLKKIGLGSVTSNYLNEISIDSNVDFYTFGLVDNSNRLSLKYLNKNTFGDLINALITFQNDLKIIIDKQSDVIVYSKPVFFNKLLYQLNSPKVKTDVISKDLVSDFIVSVLNNTKLPAGILQAIVERVKKDSKIAKDDNVNNKINHDIRLSILKSYINRECRFFNKMEEITMSLNKENNNAAYLCGRLFAVSEKVDNTDSLKRGYFANASTKPALVFPKILKLNVYRMDKLDEKVRIYYEKLLQEIIDKLDNEFPINFNLIDQGKFMVGYYQQRQDLYTKREKDSNTYESQENE